MRPGEVLRKSIHVGAGFLALLLPWLTRWQALLICLVAFIVNWQVLPRITHHFLEREEDRTRGYALGIIAYPLAVGLVLLLFGSRMEVVAATWGILAFGDGFATLAGRGIGGPRLPWNPGKTWSGLIAFVIAAGVAASGLWLWISWIRGTEVTGVEGFSGAGILTACIAAALIGALVESYPSGINDNLTVPLLSGTFLFGVVHVQPARFYENADVLMNSLLAAFLVNLAFSGVAWFAKTVTTSGAVVGLFIGTTVYAFGGWQSWGILIVFFVLGSGATKVGYRKKKERKIAQEKGGRRGARHAVANCGVPAFLAFLAAATPYGDLFLIAMVAALATAVFDTVSSEIGQVWGNHPFLITTLRAVPPGTEGAVSVEGTLAGMTAAAGLGTIAASLGLYGSFGWAGVGVVVAAAFVGTTIESVLGALGTRAGSLLSDIDNEAMNFTNTFVGAVTALGLAALVVS